MAELLLLPNLLGEHRHHQLFLPASVDTAVKLIDGLIAESETGGRRYLGRFALDKKASDVPIALLNEHSKPEDIDFLLEPMIAGERWGLVSDGGLPCIADPGSVLVYRARQRGITIKAFVGPSSIMLALMLSGLPGQRFAFHGYLDKHPEGRKREIEILESASIQDDSTQIFIEAPYRNQATLQQLVTTLSDDTMLCVAWDLTMPTQGIVSQRVATWNKCPLPNIDKKPAIFLISA